MRTAEDALRSIRRIIGVYFTADVVDYSGAAIDWEVRYWSTDGENKFPFARVAATTGITATGSAYQRFLTQTFAVHCYPRPQIDPETAVMEAARVEDLLFRIFEIGVNYVDKPDPNDPATWVTVRAPARRIPLYDYAGVPLDGPASESYTRGASDYLRVEDVSISRTDDPEDDRYTLVIAEPRVTWGRSGLLPSGTNLVESVKLKETGS